MKEYIPTEKDITDFYRNDAWRRSDCRYQALKRNNGRCELCNSSKGDGIVLVVDHIKPIRTHWKLRFDKNNLQVLCNECNMGKSSRDHTDWRKENKKSTRTEPISQSMVTIPKINKNLSNRHSSLSQKYLRNLLSVFGCDHKLLNQDQLAILYKFIFSISEELITLDDIYLIVKKLKHLDRIYIIYNMWDKTNLTLWPNGKEKIVAELQRALYPNKMVIKKNKRNFYKENEIKNKIITIPKRQYNEIS